MDLPVTQINPQFNLQSLEEILAEVERPTLPTNSATEHEIPWIYRETGLHLITKINLPELTPGEDLEIEAKFDELLSRLESAKPGSSPNKKCLIPISGATNY